jgi:tRNA(adenine34) deaminase
VINQDEILMREALKEARKAFEEDEVPVGAVITWNGRVIARAHNQTERLKDVTAHAEMVAITAAANFIGGKYLDECEMYVTLEPCIMCIGAIRHARLKRIVFGADDKRHLLPGRWDVLLPHTEIRKAVLQEDCQVLLQNFFEKKR